LPEPTPGAVIEIHEAWLVAAQLHPVGAVTMIRPTPPVAAMLADEVVVVTTQPSAACDTVCTWVPTVIVPVRGEVPVLADALKTTVELPVPSAALVTLIQGSDAVTVHAHPAPAVSANDPLPPAAGTLLPTEEIE
jgi:hypothetical protein